MSVHIERIGSIEKFGEYRRFQLAINGHVCVPVWMCEPEWRQWAVQGEDRLFDRLAFVSMIQTQNEIPLSEGERTMLAGAISEIAQRRNHHAGA